MGGANTQFRPILYIQFSRTNVPSLTLPHVPLNPQPSGQPAGARPTYLLQGHRLRGRTRTSSPSGGCPLGCSPRRAPPAPPLAPASPPRKHAFSSSPRASSVASRLAAASAWGDHHGTRWVPHARGRCVYARACTYSTWRAGASCPAPPVRAVRRRLVHVARTYRTEAYLVQV